MLVTMYYLTCEHSLTDDGEPYLVAADKYYSAIVEYRARMEEASAQDSRMCQHSHPIRHASVNLPI